MSNKKIFGVSTSLISHTGCSPCSDYVALCRNYVDVISLADGIPLMLPPIPISEDAIFEQLSKIDVLVLSGGNDVNPIWYGEEPTTLLEAVVDERDAYELELIKMAEKMHLPILGICRGLQILNVAYGGSLFQDLSFSPASIDHRQKARSHEPSHSVDIKKDSILHSIFQEEKIFTNSYHHQAIKTLGKGFTVSATSKDGIIEGIEKMGSTPIIAVQWHPEMMALKDSVMLKLFRYFL